MSVRRISAMDVMDAVEREQRVRSRMARYYCPGCGDVRTLGFTPRQRVRIAGHQRTGGDAQRHFCPGGTIDPDEDRAP
jgi:hypothetical protein